MRLMLLIGNHIRHEYYAAEILRYFNPVGIVQEERENQMPEAPENLEGVDRANFIRHFRDRETAERKYLTNEFSGRAGGIPCLRTDYNGLNSDRTLAFIRQCAPDIALIFGTGLIKEPVLSALPDYKINLHLGLSPWYKGSATLFWPFYFLEPQLAGTTFHMITPRADAGAIVSQCVPQMQYGDGIHDLGAKAVGASAGEAIRILEYFKLKGELPLTEQMKNGKLFLTSDFIPGHLRVIYNVFNNDIIDHYLDGKLSSRKVKLTRL